MSDEVFPFDIDMVAVDVCRYLVLSLETNHAPNTLSQGIFNTT